MTATATTTPSRIVLPLAISKYQRTKAIGIEPITDSVIVTPIVTAKLSARSLIGHDISSTPNNPVPLRLGKGLGVRFLASITLLTSPIRQLSTQRKHRLNFDRPIDAGLARQPCPRT